MEWINLFCVFATNKRILLLIKHLWLIYYIDILVEYICIPSEFLTMVYLISWLILRSMFCCFVYNNQSSGQRSFQQQLNILKPYCIQYKTNVIFNLLYLYVTKLWNCNIWFSYNYNPSFHSLYTNFSRT